MTWWDVLKENRKDASDLTEGDIARIKTGIQCGKCKRRFLSEKGLHMHYCRQPINFNEPMTPDENKEAKDFLSLYGLGPKGDPECPACEGGGEVNQDGESEPCPVCRG